MPILHNVITVYRKGKGMEGTPMEGIITALTTAMTTVKTDFFSALTSILPVALAIVGAGMVIVLGVKYFKRIANK